MRLPVVCNLILSSPFLPLKRFCGNGFFRRPSLFQATIHQFFLDSISFCPFCRCECFSVYGQKRFVTSCSSVLLMGCPSAITGGISLVFIHPVASQFVRISIRRRPTPNLRKIVFPLWAHTNASTAVPFICLVIFVKAPCLDPSPYSEKPCVGVAVRFVQLS